jgi:hypothetical protein
MTTVTCQRCKVPVEADKVDLPNRCNDPDCPLAKPRPPLPHPVVVVAVGAAILVLLAGIVRNITKGASYGVEQTARSHR